MRRRLGGIGSWLCVIALTLLAGCSSKVWVMIPPDVDLTGYERIGLIEFSSTDPGLRALATRQFQQEVQSAQPGLRVVELGDGRQLLQSVGRSTLDAEAVELIAARHDLDALFIGDLELSKVTPRIDLSVSLIELRGRADIHAMMSARLVERDGGATVWTCSSRDTITIAHADVASSGIGSIGAADPEGRYGPLVEGLASRIAADFRAEYIRRRLEDVPPHYVPEYPDGVEVYAPPRLTFAGGS
jgi:hypothetical protein